MKALNAYLANPTDTTAAKLQKALATTFLAAMLTAKETASLREAGFKL